MTTPHPTRVRILLMWNWDRFPEGEGFMLRQPYRLTRHTDDDREWAIMDKRHNNTPRVQYSSEGLGRRRYSRNFQTYRSMRHNGHVISSWEDGDQLTVKDWLAEQ